MHIAMHDCGPTGDPKLGAAAALCGAVKTAPWTKYDVKIWKRTCVRKLWGAVKRADSPTVNTLEKKT